jgi:hypothetical protein
MTDVTRALTMADVAALESQVKDAGETVRLMKEANKATPGTHSKVELPAAVCAPRCDPAELQHSG